ncbi:MAG: PucR family transcriptional regulator ligand-binding domain-containing protein, partial [Actinomycetia bacterium]|nr:PucR family transcriptional regulator ligand-binding domain-containing protein [Actinomycetes bacterium]
MRLRDLLAVPDLALSLLVGDDDALDQPVRSTYSSDLLDPSRYLSGGEVVVTGLVWRRAESDSEAFVANVARAGAGGIAAGTAQFGGIPDDVIDACRRHGLALLAVPEHVSFTAVTEHVLGAAAAERGARLESRLAMTRELLAAFAQGDPLDAVLARVADRTGTRFSVLTATGRYVVSGAPLSEGEVSELVRGFLTAERLPLALPDGRLVHPVGGALGSRLAMWMLVAEPGGDADESAAAAAEVASLVRLAQTRLEETRRSTRSLADEAMRMVAAGRTTQAETTLRLERAGLDLDAASYAVVVLGLDGEGDDLRDLAEEIFADMRGSIVA